MRMNYVSIDASRRTSFWIVAGGGSALLLAPLGGKLRALKDEPAPVPANESAATEVGANRGELVQAFAAASEGARFYDAAVQAGATIPEANIHQRIIEVAQDKHRQLRALGALLGQENVPPIGDGKIGYRDSASFLRAAARLEALTVERLRGLLEQVEPTAAPILYDMLADTLYHHGLMLALFEQFAPPGTVQFAGLATKK